MTVRVWHKGPPPHVGWWNSSQYHSESVWRWWNGEYWSDPVGDHYSIELAAKKAAIQTTYKDVRWTDYYPENARVPRI
jgi:hypothetical protein